MKSRGRKPALATVVLVSSITSITPGGSVSSHDTPSASPVTAVAPRYPVDARQNRVQGIVTVGVEIDPSGSVKTARVKRGIPFFDGAVIAAARGWRFAASNNEPIRQAELIFSFRLVPKASPPAAPPQASDGAGTVFTLPGRVEVRELEPES